MEATKALGQSLPEAAKDIRLNLHAVLVESSLSERQRWGVAVACAIASRHRALRAAVIADAAAHLDEAALDDAHAAAALMAMNSVYYRFRHMIGKPSYASLPAKLRMNRIAQPRTAKHEFELLCLAVSAINGCEMCIKSHEPLVLQGGMTEANVNDAVRIAATMHAAAVGLEMAGIE